MSDAFPSNGCLCLAGWGERRKPERGIIEVLASVYVCVWVSIALFSLVATTATVSSPNPSPPPPPPTLRVQVFPSHVLLSDCPPANSKRPTCVCAPVWLLAPSVWTARRRKTHQVGEALRLGKKRAPVVRHRLFPFSTSERRKPRRLSKLYQEKASAKWT